MSDKPVYVVEIGAEEATRMIAALRAKLAAAGERGRQLRSRYDECERSMLHEADRANAAEVRK